jgi:hypothetical protein
MRTWLVILSITSVALAGTTTYLAWQLHELSSTQAAPATSLASAPGPAPAVARSAPASSVPVTAPAATPPTVATASDASRGNSWRNFAPGQRLSEEDIRKLQSEHARHFLAQIADPQQREEMLAQRRMHLRNQYPRVDQVLGLSAEEHARFLELLTLQQVDMQETSSRCIVDPQCPMQSAYRGGADTRSQEIASLLGSDRMQKFETYKNTMGEREAITQLRSRLSDAQRLGDDKAEQLISALAQERDALHREALNNGTGMNGFGIGAGMVYSPNDGRSLEERFQAARQNSQRLRDRAAQYLNAEQQRIFNEMQEETLLSLRSMLRQKDGQTVDGVTFSAVAISSGN